MKNCLRLVGFLTCAFSAAALMPVANAQSRAGTIEDIQPIENRGDDTSERTKRGRTLGERLGKLGGLEAGVGLTQGGNSQAGLVVTGVAATHGDAISGALGERMAGEGPTTRYMVKVRLDEGRVLSLTQLREEVGGLGSAVGCMSKEQVTKRGWCLRLKR